MSKIKSIDEIKIRKFMGIDELALSLKAPRTIVCGKNSTGKTSLIEAFSSALGTGYPVELIHRGAEQAEIGILFDDESGLEKVISNKKRNGSFGTLQIFNSEGRRISASAKYMTDVYNQLSFNPGELLKTDKRARKDALLKSMPIELDKDDLLPILIKLSEDEFKDVTGESDPASALKNLMGVHALTAIASLEKSFFKARTGINQQLKQSKASADEFRETLPEIIDGLDEQVTKFEEEQGMTDHLQSQEMEEINNEYNRGLGKGREAYYEAMENIKNESDKTGLGAAKRYNAEIESLRKQIIDLEDRKNAAVNNVAVQKQRQLLELKDQQHEKKQQLSEKRNSMIDEIRDKYSYKADSLKETLMGLRERQKTQAAAVRQRELLNNIETDVDYHNKRSLKFTAIIESLRELKTKKLEGLPIDNVEIIGGELLYNGVPFDQVNTGHLIALASKISELYSQQTGFRFAFWDSLERVDSENMQLIFETFEKAKIKLLATYVTDDDELKIYSEEEPAANSPFINRIIRAV